MKTSLSKAGHALFESSFLVREANALLSAAARSALSLELEGLSFHCQHAHFGPGVYPLRRSAALHVHNELQIEYVVTGLFDFTIDGVERRLGPWQGSVISPRQPHEWICREAGAMLGVVMNVVGPNRGAFVRHALRKQNSRRTSFGSPATAAILLQMIDVLQGPRSNLWAQERVRCLLELWLRQALSEAVDLSRWQPKTNEREQYAERGLEICRRVLEFMESNYWDPLRLEDVALQVGVSPRHLNRLFRRYQHDSINNALLQIRLNHAMEMLVDEKPRQIKEIAYACGFSSAAYFTHCFRKEFGILPSEARARAK